MANNFSVKKNNSTRNYIGGEMMYFNNNQIKQLWVKKGGTTKMVWQYDITAPALSVTTPSSTSSGSPTFTTGSVYTVQGTISDTESGVASVTVNGVKATISGNNWSYNLSLSSGTTTTVTIVATDNAGNKVTVTRYVRYYVLKSVTGQNSSTSGGTTGKYSGTDFYARSSGTITTGKYAKSKSLNFTISCVGNQWPGPTKDTYVIAYNSSGGEITRASGQSLTLNDTQAQQCSYFVFHWDTEGRNYNIGAGQSYGFTATWSWTQSYYA